MADLKDEGLHLEITADASKASAAFISVTEKVAKLQGATDGATASTKLHHEAQTILGSSMGKTETATNAMARAFSAFGLESSAATSRVLSFSEALDATAASAGPLLLVGTALLAIGASINFITEGVKNAAKEQQTLSAIGVAIKVQGKAFADAREEVEKYATSLSQATTFSRGEALDAVRALTTAGVSLGDTQKIVAVATDVAAGSGRSLVDVVNEIKQAEVGRALGLAQLDPRLKAIIKSHGTLQEVLDELARTYAGQASAATDTFSGKQAILKNRLEELGEVLGMQVMPALQVGTELLIGFAGEAERQVPVWVAYGKNIVSVFDDIKKHIQDVLDTFAPFFELLDRVGQMDKGFNAKAYENSLLPAAFRKNLGTSGSSGGGGFDSSVATGGGGFGGGGTDILSAIAASSATYAPGSGLSAKQIATYVTAIGQQETNLGNSSNYNAATGRDRDGNQGRGVFQLDPASGASSALLDRVSTNVQAAADEATKMFVAGLKNNNGSILASIEAYGPHLKGGAPDPAYVTSVMRLVNNSGQGRTGVPMMDNALTDGQIQMQAYQSSWATRTAALAKQRLDNNPQIGNVPIAKGPRAEKAATVYSAMEDLSNDPKTTDGLTEAQKRLDAQLKVITDSERAYKVAVDNASSAQELKSAKEAQATKITADGVSAYTLLINAIGRERDELVTAKAARDRDGESALESYARYQTLLHATNMGTTATKEQRHELEESKRQFGEHQRAVVDDNRAIATLTGEIDKNSASLEVQVERIGETTKAMAEAARKAEDLLNKNIASRQLIDQKNAAERAAYGLSLAQQEDYYSQQYANEVAANGKFSDEAKRLYEEMGKLDLDLYKKRVDEAKANAERIVGYETTFLDDFITKGKSLRDSLKDTWNNIVKDFEAALIKMIESKYLHQLVARFANFIGLGSSFSLGGGGGASAGAGALGGLGSIFGSGASSSGAVFSLSPTSIEKLTGSSQGVAGMGYSSNPSGGGYGFGAGDGAGGANATSFLGRAAGGALQGLAIGGILSSMTGGNSSNASIGGALGGIAGALFKHINPIVGLGIDVVTSLIGGLFGPHLSAFKNPDIMDTQNYAQGLANATGRQAGANGYTAQADANVLGVTGGKGQIGFIETLLAQGKDAYMKATGETADQYAKALSIIGASATGAGTIKFGKNIGDQTIVGATSGGNTQTRYNELDNLLNSILTDYTKAGGQPGGPAPAFKLDRLYPDANIASLRDAKGNIIGGPRSPNNLRGSDYPDGTLFGPKKDPNSNTHPITINVSGNVIGNNGMHDLAEIISRAVYDNDTGLGKSGFVVSGPRRFNGDGS